MLNTDLGTQSNRISTDEPETTHLSNHLTPAEPEPEPEFEPEPEPDIASLYRFCLWIDDYDYFADTPELSPNVLVFALERAPDPLYEPNDSEFLPLLLEEIHRNHRTLCRGPPTDTASLCPPSRPIPGLPAPLPGARSANHMTSPPNPSTRFPNRPIS